MRITLKNFRCHIDYTIDIPEQGLVALSGDNGSGKSTLFAAISYAFYGKNPGKKRKPLTHGKTTCSVEIEYMGMVVTRKVPKRLMVTYNGQDYEGDEAQSIIIETLGMTYDEFVGSSYVVQSKGSDMSVLSLSPAQQIDFVQTLSNSTAKKYVLETREKIKTVNTDMLGIQGELKALQSQKEEKLGIYPDIPELPEEMEQGVDPADVRHKIEVMEAKLEGIQSSLEKIRPRLEKARADEKRRADQEIKISKFKVEIEQLQKLRASLVVDGEPSEEQIETWSQEIEEDKSAIDYCRRYLSYLKDSASLDKAIKEFNISVDTKLRELEEQVLDPEAIEILEKEVEVAEQVKKEYDVAKAKHDMETARREDVRKSLADKFREIKMLPGIPKDIKTASKMIVALEKEIENRKWELKTKAKKKMCCPGCSSYLIMTDEEHLELVDEPTEEYDESLQASIEASIKIISEFRSAVKELSLEMNTKITPLGDEPEDPVALYKELLKAKRIRQEYENLQLRKLPAVIERMQQSVDQARKEFETYTPPEHLTILEEELHAKISKKDAASALMVTLLTHEEQIMSKQKALSKLEKTPRLSDTKNISTLEDQVTSFTKKMADLSGEISIQRKILDNVSDYEHYQHVLLEIEEITGRIDEANGRHLALEQKMEGLFGLEETEKEAEIMALETTVSSINEHARIYLDQMFADPIMVRLECTKDRGKKGVKLQLHTAIDYRGETFDDVDELSGGERQKCDIAFLLAVNDMMGSNILILDECFNELHASANTEVLSLIRDYCGASKMVLIVSHEAVRGIFDTEIMVG